MSTNLRTTPDEVLGDALDWSRTRGAREVLIIVFAAARHVEEASRKWIPEQLGR